MLVEQGTISNILLHPFTGARGIELEQAKLSSDGLYNRVQDRGRLLYDPASKMRVSSKPNQAPELVRVALSESNVVSLFGMDGMTVEGEFTLGLPDDEPITLLEFPDKDGTNADEIDCYDYGDDIAQIFSDFINARRPREKWVNVRLALKDLTSHNREPYERRNAPVHVIALSTITHLAEISGETIESIIRRYRPTLIIGDDVNSNKGGFPERQWKEIVFESGSKILLPRETVRCGVPPMHPFNGSISPAVRGAQQQAPSPSGGRQKLIGRYGYLSGRSLTISADPPQPVVISK